jgi:hypothetical protein
MAIGMAPMGITKAKTAYELAHDVASKNAEKMLGLPKGNTYVDRAKALGYETPLFHETSAENLGKLKGFNVKNAVAAATDEQTPYSVFTKRKGDSIGLAREGEVQMPLLVRPGVVDAFSDRNALTANLGATRPELKDMWRNIGQDEGARAKEIDKLGEMLGTRAHKNTSGMSNADIWKQIDDIANGDPALIKQAKEVLTDEFMKRGVDSVAIFNDAGSMGRSAMTNISLNPANIRSRFAAFDPARINENDLLAGLAPYLGIGGLLSLGLITPEEAQAK